MKVAIVTLLLTAALSVSSAFASPVVVDVEADTATANAIDARFHADDLIAYVDVDVRVKNGIATLRGTARTREAKAAALREARAIPGVSDIVSQIAVRPSLL